MKLPPPGDQEEFYAQLLRNCRTEPEKSIIMLLWRTGMHASTLAERSFELHRNGVYWKRPKTGKPLEALIAESELRTVARVLNAGSLPNTVRTLERWVARIGERAGYAGISPLTLRHSRAIWLIDGGMPALRVAHALGCSLDVLERHYAQIEAARLVQ